MELKVFVEPGCELCVWALATANEIKKRFPAVIVTIVDIGKGEGPIPDSVFAVPTYVLDGNVVSLGNPALEELDKTIRARVMASRSNSST